MRVDSTLTAISNHIDIADRIRQWLTTMPLHQPGIHDAGRQFDRRERSLLTENELSIQPIADVPGLSSVTSLHRAFKRWPGTTPVSRRNDGTRG